ncbi:VTCN1 inhibitor, partial [Upupa epops]|nr:VTCN1 inhibitor [Upupa epops]
RETALWMVTCLLFASPRRGQLDKTCHAVVGETVVLPCSTSSPGELSTSKLYWQIDLVIVHFFHNGQDSLQLQDRRYRGRTSLFLEQMERGNLSLKLSDAQLQDSAEYTCIYRATGHRSSKTQKSKVKLIVSAAPSTERPSSPSGHSKMSSRSPADTPRLAALLLGFHLLVTLG